METARRLVAAGAGPLHDHAYLLFGLFLQIVYTVGSRAGCAPPNQGLSNTVHNVTLYSGSRGPSVRPANLLSTMLIRGPGDLGPVGRHQLGRGETHLWRVAPYPTGFVSVPAFELGRCHTWLNMPLRPPPPALAVAREGPGTNHPFRLGSQPNQPPNASAALRFALLHLRERRFL